MEKNERRHFMLTFEKHSDFIVILMMRAKQSHNLSEIQEIVVSL